MIINFADKSLLGIAAQPIMKDLNLAPSRYGMIASSFFLLFSISSLIVGFLTEKYPTKKILLIMAAVWTVTQCIMFSPMAGVWTLLLTRILLGAAEGPSYGVTNHAAMKWFPVKRRGIVTAALGVAVPTGTMLASPIVGNLVATAGWRTAFLLLGITSLAWGLVWFRIGSEGPFDDSADRQKAGPLRKVAYRHIFLTRTFIGSLVGGIASYWSVVLLISWVPLYLATTKGLDPGEVGWAFSVPWGVQILAIAIIGGGISTWLINRGVSTRWARGALAGAAVTLSGVAMILFVLAEDGIAKVVLMAIAFGLSGCAIPISQAINAEISPNSQRGGVLGAYVAVYSITGVVAPAATGALVESAETPLAGYNQMFIFSAILLIVGGLVYAGLVNPEKDAKRIAEINIENKN
ncbi:MFS transporter [Rhodococcus sp. IEGM 248]|nr:MFS transporter [Rhodococcus sp. IEGM 248]